MEHSNIQTKTVKVKGPPPGVPERRGGTHLPDVCPVCHDNSEVVSTLIGDGGHFCQRCNLAF